MNQGAAHDTSALPGGHKVIDAGAERRSWRQIIGFEMPNNSRLHELVDKFFVSVDWFMMVFHEPLFRQRYQALLESDQVAYHEENFLWLFAVVVALGAKYEARATTVSVQRVALEKLSLDLLAQVEARFLNLIGCATLEAVQICILVGSCLLFSGRPNVGLGISAAGVKIAQVINLHREKRWTDSSAAVLETKRRTWWALEVYDKYAAVAFGRPCTIDDADCSINMISDVLGEAPNPLLICHQHKFQLYRIMGRFIGRRRLPNDLRNARAIQEELTQWRDQLPSELQMDTYLNASDEEPTCIQMQVLSLQLTYDNLQIILHRSVTVGEGTKVRATPDGLYSLEQLLEAGMRTASLHRFPRILQASRKTHADMHVGITLFTAGVVLCVICLAQPLSPASERAKQGIMQIIRMCKDNADNHSAASKQSVAILERLVAVVLQRENQVITGQDAAAITDPANTLTTAPETYQLVAQNSEAATSQVVELRRSQRQPHTNEQSESISGTATEQTGLPSAGLDWMTDPLLMTDFEFSEASQLFLWTNDADLDG
ncbi:hypothetical protein VHEMI04396 [[Torrubiella] hemipterigena]|nr:hypothetical protein VHEMI04396 [[Torrubiella] hemipterigena]